MKLVIMSHDRVSGAHRLLSALPFPTRDEALAEVSRLLAAGEVEPDEELLLADLDNALPVVVFAHPPGAEAPAPTAEVVPASVDAVPAPALTLVRPLEEPAEEPAIDEEAPEPGAGVSESDGAPEPMATEEPTDEPAEEPAVATDDVAEPSPEPLPEAAASVEVGAEAETEVAPDVVVPFGAEPEPVAEDTPGDDFEIDEVFEPASVLELEPPSSAEAPLLVTEPEADRDAVVPEAAAPEMPLVAEPAVAVWEEAAVAFTAEEPAIVEVPALAEFETPTVVDLFPEPLVPATPPSMDPDPMPTGTADLAAALEAVLPQPEETVSLDEPGSVTLPAAEPAPTAVETAEPLAEPADAGPVVPLAETSVPDGEAALQWPWDVPESTLDDVDSVAVDDEDTGLEAVAAFTMTTETSEAEAVGAPAVTATAHEPVTAEGLADALAISPLAVAADTSPAPAAADASPAFEEDVSAAAAAEVGGGYEPGTLDMTGYTCDDCVYVNTCPNQHGKAPAECGSFQWRSM